MAGFKTFLRFWPAVAEFVLVLFNILVIINFANFAFFFEDLFDHIEKRLLIERPLLFKAGDDEIEYAVEVEGEVFHDLSIPKNALECEAHSATC